MDYNLCTGEEGKIGVEEEVAEKYHLHIKCQGHDNFMYDSAYNSYEEAKDEGEYLALVSELQTFKIISQGNT